MSAAHLPPPFSLSLQYVADAIAKAQSDGADARLAGIPTMPEYLPYVDATYGGNEFKPYLVGAWLYGYNNGSAGPGVPNLLAGVRTVLAFGLSSVVSLADLDAYCVVGGPWAGLDGNVESDGECLSPLVGTYKEITVQLDAPTTVDLTFTVRANGVDTDCVVTVPVGDSSVGFTGGTTAAADGDVVSVHATTLVANASVAAATVLVAIEPLS